MTTFASELLETLRDFVTVDFLSRSAAEGVSLSQKTSFIVKFQGNAFTYSEYSRGEFTMIWMDANTRRKLEKKKGDFGDSLHVDSALSYVVSSRSLS